MGPGRLMLHEVSIEAPEFLVVSLLGRGLPFRSSAVIVA